jgi:hypothetical protein
MTNRDVQLKAWREYQEALREAEKKKPEGSWYKVPADDGSGEARLIYDPATDSMEFSLAGNTVTISGKYFMSFTAALDSLLEEKRS